MSGGGEQIVVDGRLMLLSMGVFVFQRGRASPTPSEEDEEGGSSFNGSESVRSKPRPFVSD